MQRACTLLTHWAHQIDIVDLTLDEIHLPSKKPKLQRPSTTSLARRRAIEISEDEDDEYEGVKSQINELKHASIIEKSKGKARMPPSQAQVDVSIVPSSATLETWRNGADDLEASTKMLALIDELKIAEEAGDRTICYSQCTFRHLLASVLYSITIRDYDARFGREIIHSVRNSQY